MDNAIAGTSYASEVTANRLEALANSSSAASGELAATKGLTRLDVFHLLNEENKKMNGRTARLQDLTIAERTCLIKSYLGDSLVSSLSVVQEKELSKAIGLFLTKIEKKYTETKRNITHFKNKHKDWLTKLFIHDLPQDLHNTRHEITDVLPPENEIVSEDSINFSSVTLPECSGGSNEIESVSINRRTQLRARKRLEFLIEDEPPAKLIKTFSKVITSTDNNKLSNKSARDLETVINICLESPSKPTEILAKINQQTNPYTPEEALGIIIDRKYSVETYNFLRQDLNKRGFCAFPPYSKVAKAKQDCYPEEGVLCNEIEASVSLQGLLTHTFRRIILLCDDIINEYCEREHFAEICVTFEGSWGFDGSTGQSFYKQKSPQDLSYDESTIFATTFVPLRIVETSRKETLWLNPTPQSFRSCRPLHIQYRKESKDLILGEKDYVEEQLRHLAPITALTTKGFSIKTTCNLTLSIIDGKVYNIIHKTYSQLRCPICKLTSTKFNDLDLAFSTPIDKEAIKNGMSPLHAFIRCLEFLLHLGYKNDPSVRQWRVSKSSNAGKITEDRKKRIQAAIRDRLGLLVDVVRPRSGTTNDGNTARRVFATYESRGIFAEILGLSRWLVDDIHVILVAINCGLPIDSVKFGNFCKSLAKKYVEAYTWHPMTTTMHKILIHGQNIIESSALPVGLLSEQAGESRNKFWRYDREHHSRKDNRQHTIKDLFQRALESSDPVVSSTRLTRRQKSLKKISLPPPVIEMLKPFEFNDNDDDDDDENVADDGTETDESEFTSVLTNENDTFTE